MVRAFDCVVGCPVTNYYCLIHFIAIAYSFRYLFDLEESEIEPNAHKHYQHILQHYHFERHFEKAPQSVSQHLLAVLCLQN